MKYISIDPVFQLYDAKKPVTDSKTSIHPEPYLGGSYCELMHIHALCHARLPRTYIWFNFQKRGFQKWRWIDLCGLLCKQMAVLALLRGQSKSKINYHTNYHHNRGRLKMHSSAKLEKLYSLATGWNSRQNSLRRTVQNMYIAEHNSSLEFNNLFPLLESHSNTRYIISWKM